MCVHQYLRDLDLCIVIAVKASVCIQLHLCRVLRPSAAMVGGRDHTHNFLYIIM